MMKRLMTAFVPWAVIAMLSACGGSSSDGGVTQAPGYKISIQATTFEVPANTENLPVTLDSPFFTQVTVSVSFNSGGPATDGTVVSATIDPVMVAALTVLDDPSTPDINEFAALYGQVTAETSGGKATFFVHGISPGSAVFTASATFSENGGYNRTTSASATFTVTEGPDPVDHIAVEATKSRLPSNTFGVGPFSGSPYMSELIVTVRDAYGQLMTEVDGLSVSINPVEIASFSTLDDGETDDVNEFLVTLGSGPVNITGGKSHIFVHAKDKPGIATVTMTAVDPVDGTIHEAAFDIEVVEDASTGRPHIMSAVIPSYPQYVQGAGGPDSKVFEVHVLDGGNEPVPDPEGYNNLEIKILSPNTSSGAMLQSTGGGGGINTGTQVEVATVAGVATATLIAGTEPGLVSLQVTADRADNNTSNGIQDPITDLFSMVIGDGRLHSIEIVSPNVESIITNIVTSESLGDNIGLFDGSYSLTVTAEANDRYGNPVLPGTQIQFMTIDYPVIGYPESGAGLFVLSGSDGNPEEGGRQFDAASGEFLDNSIWPDFAAQPGDLLMLFGEEIPGNHEHESVRIVESVQSDTRLRVSTDFNPNNGTGAIINDGPVIPYVVGRAQNVNITGSAATNEKGFASTQLNYPSNNLGRVVIVSAQGTGVATGSKAAVKTVADVEAMLLPGVGPLQFSVFADQIPANMTVDLLMCLADANGAPVSGAFVQFSGANTAGATITVDGQQGAGTVLNATGADGCTVATVASTGVLPGSEVVITFFVGGLSDSVDVVAPSAVALYAIPNAFVGSRTATITLRLVDGGGNPVPDAQIFLENGACDNTGSGISEVISPPGSTNSDGETYTTIRVTGVEGIDESGEVACTFTTASGEPVTVVNFYGYDICDSGFSPIPEGCAAK